MSKARIATLLGAAGLIPFVATAMGASGIFDLDTEQGARLLEIQVAYGAAILSFLGGIIWGRTLTLEGPGVPGFLAFSVIPSLLGWSALLFDTPVAHAILSAGFLMTLGGDRWLYRTGRYERWFWHLRIALTSVVVISLVTGVGFWLLRSAS